MVVKERQDPAILPYREMDFGRIPANHRTVASVVERQDLAILPYREMDFGRIRGSHRTVGRGPVPRHPLSLVRADFYSCLVKNRVIDNVNDSTGGETENRQKSPPNASRTTKK